MGKLTSLFTNREKRMPAVLIICFLVIAFGAVFIGNELIQNRAYYIREYTKRQQEETDILKEAMEGKSPEEMVSFIRMAFPASGARWMFLYGKEGVVFAQNDTTTGSLGKMKETDAFLSYLEGQKGILTVSGSISSDGGESFYTGIITDEDHALGAAKITKHEIYIILSVSVMVLIFAGGLIFVTGLLNSRDKNLVKVHGELTKRNEKFTEYEEELHREEAVENERLLKEESGRNEKGYYDRDVLRLLLKKSDDEALFPVTFLFARVVMEERYYGRDEIFGAMGFIKDRLKNTQIMAETGKGKFVAVLYKTGLSEANEQRKEMLAAWRESDKSRDLKLELKLCPVIEKESPLEAFEKSGFEENF